jgi:hypothetical protein
MPGGNGAGPVDRQCLDRRDAETARVGPEFGGADIDRPGAGGRWHPRRPSSLNVMGRGHLELPGTANERAMSKRFRPTIVPHSVPTGRHATQLALPVAGAALARCAPVRLRELTLMRLRRWGRIRAW